MVQWPDEQNEGEVKFPGNREESGGALLNLDHPRIRGLLSRLPIHGKGEPIPRFRVSGLPKTIDGYWSLWVLRLTSFDFRRARVFPVFVNRDGRPFAQTARHVWDKLATLDLEPSGWITQEESLAVHDQIYKTAAGDGHSLWQELERQHRQRWEEEKGRAQYHFTARRRLLDQIGLSEVRGYRLRQLEAEETERMAQLESQRNLLPDIEPLAIFSIDPL